MQVSSGPISVPKRAHQSKIARFVPFSILWTSTDSARWRESRARCLREAATSHGKEAGVLGRHPLGKKRGSGGGSPWERSGGPGAAAPGKKAGVRGRQPLGKKRGGGGGSPRESFLSCFCRVVAFLHVVEVRQVYPVSARSAPSQGEVRQFPGSLLTCCQCT